VKQYMEIGDKVSHSPMGAGTITDFTERGYPRVNHVAVGWLRLETGETFNPHGHDIDAAVATNQRGGD
jgi:hypothetical protein